MERAGREFVFTYRVEIPPCDAPLDLWIPRARTDAWQTVELREVSAPVRLDEGLDPREGNRMVHGRFPGHSGERSVEMQYEIRRAARAAGPAPASEPAGLSRHLAADARVPVDGYVAELASRAAARSDPPLVRARGIFDYVIGTFEYDGGGCTPERAHRLGDLETACDLKRGTCTELHGIYVACARALGLPTRFAFGFNVPRRSEGTIAGYHCWCEVFLPETGWLPVDVSEGRKRGEGAERDFYFGHLDPDRVQFSGGRDVELVPPARGGAVDRFIFPVAEAAGERVDVKPSFSFRDGPTAGL
jgi:transglutaminase-like putative cysteine protease